MAFNISVLRKLFADSSASPHYIETVPKRGYRFIAEVVEIAADQFASAQSTPEAPPANLNPTAPVPGTRNSPELLRSFGRVQISIAAVILALIGFLIWRVPAKPPLREKDRIVLADFVNRTGDPVFDATMRQGLGIQLEQSPYLSVVSEQRLRQTLHFMRQPTDVLITPALAREICRRTGSSVVLEGSIGRLGNEYVLGLRATDCGGEEILDNQQLQIRKKEDILSALTQIVHQFRSRVGESQTSLEKHEVPLAEATTASIEALKAYSTAWQLLASHGATAALPLFTRAIELDPDFTMANASLGRIYADLDQPANSAASLTKAWQLRDRTSDRERFFITANYQMLVEGNLESSRKTGEAWARTYPRDAAPHMMLSGYVNKGAGRFENALT